MSIRICRRSELQPAQVIELDRRLAEYYANPPTAYYSTANDAAAKYTPNILPFHCDLIGRVEEGMTFLELGCGTAHLCPHVESRGARYTGVDYSAELLENNRQRFPRARFLPIGTDLDERFDIVASLYTIEHVADPPAYLERMWNLCRVGGLLAVICPEFIDCDSLPPSLFYGRTPRRFREKLANFAFGDAWAHIRELTWDARRWHERAQATPPGAFWINLHPRVLHRAKYSIDADAVHFSRLKDLVWWFEQHGAAVLETSQTLGSVSPEILRYNCYVLARKGTG